MILYPMLYEITHLRLFPKNGRVNYKPLSWQLTIYYNPFHPRGKGNEFRDSERKGMGSSYLLQQLIRHRSITHLRLFPKNGRVNVRPLTWQLKTYYIPFHLRGKGNEFRDSVRKGMGSIISTSTTDTPQMYNPSPSLT